METEIIDITKLEEALQSLIYESNKFYEIYASMNEISVNRLREMHRQTTIIQEQIKIITTWHG